MTVRSRGSCFCSLALLLAVAGCGSEGGDGASGTGSLNAPAPAPDGPVATAIDACSLLSAQDVSALLGITVEGKPTSRDPEAPGCLWENPDNYESISLEIGEPGSAVDNTLRPPEPGFPEVGTPGPDGMRFLGNGQVEFPAGFRDNAVQVAVLQMSAAEADAAAVELARKIGPQLPSPAAAP